MLARQRLTPDSMLGLPDLLYSCEQLAIGVIVDLGFLWLQVEVVRKQKYIADSDYNDYNNLI